MYIMKTEIKVLKELIPSEEGFTIRELSRRIGSDYRITYLSVKKLADKGLLDRRVIGKSILVRFNRRFSAEVFKAEHERAEEIHNRKDFEIISETIRQSIKTVHLIILLFGSYAKKTQTKNSDIDLMVIAPGTEHEKEVEQAVSLIPLPIHLLFFTEEEFARMRDSREGNVGKEAMKNNMILYGIEQYYGLLE